MKADPKHERQQEAHEKIYSFQNQPPESFVAQVAFTMLNGFLLTTDGRLFSWGGHTFCLGREPSTSSSSEGDSYHSQLGEVEGFFPSFLVSIACGRSHVLALDRDGRVYSWGKNEFGQLGLGGKGRGGDSGIGAADRQVPTLIENIGGETTTKIIQIYAFENMSFAVDKHGTIYAWGQNKNNILALGKTQAQQKIVDIPSPIIYPSFFHQPLIKNTSDGKMLEGDRIKLQV